MDAQRRLYGIAAGSFLVRRIPDMLDRLEAVILFGSIAQGKGDDSSDLDLFFDIRLSEAQRRRLQARLRAAEADFRLSQEALQFKLNGIANPISCTVGKLEEWKDLERSIAATGIVLYGRYARPVGKEGLKRSLLVVWEASGKRRGAFLNKLYGYRIGRKRYSGLLERIDATKVGKSAALIPLGHGQLLFKTLDAYETPYTVIEVFQP